MPSVDVRKQALAICREISEQIDQYMIMGCLADAMPTGLVGESHEPEQC